MTKPIAEFEQTCLCGRSYICKSYHIHLERVLCEKCFVREAKIVLFKNRADHLYNAGVRQSVELAKVINRLNMLRNERTYSIIKLIDTKEYSIMAKMMS